MATVTDDQVDECAEQAMTRDGYDQIEITGRRDIPVRGLPHEIGSWIVSGTARFKDGKRYYVTVHVKRNFGGVYGDKTQQGPEIS